MLRNLKQFNLPEIEEKVLKFWKENDIFQKSLDIRKQSKPFRFFEGPPTANGRPGMHHVLARAFKDIICRYKTMRGYFVLRRAGWDTHGLPVEIEVEKELGLKNKQEIEKFGIAEFNERAKMSIWKYKGDWEKLTERVGFWLDFDQAYVTYESKYIETLWWIFGQFSKKGLLKKLYKIVPWCPRCQTPLSSHELGQPGAYKKTKDPSLYVKFRIKNSSAKEFLLVWTTTPWTLPANVAVAIHPQLTYTKYKIGDEYLWSHNPPPEMPGQEIEVIEKISGKKLVGLEYEPLYKNGGEHKVLAADFVSTEDGTGMVHIAPAFGEDDLQLIKAQSSKLKAQNFEIPITVDDGGLITANVPGKGKFIKQADKDIVADLEKRGLVYKSGEVEHEYPFCWRCSTPLIYFARDSWFILMSQLRDELIAANKKINWIPSHIQDGRFGEWLRELKDWAISRNRYWGTPLPIWEHMEEKSCNETLVIGSLAELNEHAYYKNKIFMARHCEADHNLSGIIASGPERGENVSRLTAKGKEQAKKMAQELKKKGIDIIYASPYKRTQETAKIIAKLTGAKVVTDKRLGEINSGVFNGRPISDHKKFFEGPLEEFTKTPPGGENLNDVKARMLDFLKDINSRHESEKILIVSHGDPVWVMAGAAKGLSSEGIMSATYPEVGAYYEVELYNWPLNRRGELDVHRPFVDEIYLKCPECKSKMSRVKEVADVWFDSGAMPFAEWHYPFENKGMIDKKIHFPADYISEGIDQTRGWFYTLLAISMALGKGLPYHNVISLGLLLDKNGQKMSKSKGNVVDPWQMTQKYGADVMRWYFYTVNPPGEPKKFDEQDLAKTFRKVFMILYNCYVFLETYGSEKGNPNKILDEWVLARLDETKLLVTENLEKYEIGDAAKAIESFTDDFSRWYIRRSRKNVSPKTLAVVLETVAKLMAPFAPFFSEALHKSLVTSHSSSVHLEDWPGIDKKSVNKDLIVAMAEVRRLAALALAEREKAGIKVRQPLAELRIKNKESRIKNEELLALLKDEINVKEVIFDNKIKSEIELDTKITSELREEGIVRELTRMVQGLRHDAGCQVKDKIDLYIEASVELNGVIEKHQATLKKAVHAGRIELKKSAKIDTEISSKLDGQPIWIGLNK